MKLQQLHRKIVVNKNEPKLKIKLEYLFQSFAETWKYIVSVEEREQSER